MTNDDKTFQCSECPLMTELQRALSDVYRLAQLVELVLTDTTARGETTQAEKTTRALARRILAQAAKPYQPVGEYYTPEAVAKMAGILSKADGGPVHGNPLNVEDD